MIQRFQQFISGNGLIADQGRVLLAVSGGADSTVMAYLFSQSAYSCAVAHCNFGLRGEESDADERFVRNMAEAYGMPFFSRRFATEDEASASGGSIQMAARKLRYKWFDALCREQGFEVVAVATHLTDQLETMLINQVRGTGIAGLQGIRNKRGRVIRPMMFATAEEIRAFAKERNIAFREDSSNLQDAYVRNRIRQQVLPALKQINPSVEGTWKDNAARLRDVFSVYELAMDEMKSRLLREAPGGYEIEIAALKALSPFRSCLYELLHPFGFNTSQLADIACALDGDPGKVFHSPTHRILRDRKTLIIQKLSTSRIPEPIFIDGCTREVIAPLHLVFGELPNDNVALKSGQATALLDRDKLEFPLLLRPWQHGDVFCPFGMTTHKKVSDFLVDAKVPITEKERTFVLLSGDSIVWLVGLRIDNRFCITGKTKHIFRAELLRSDG